MDDRCKLVFLCLATLITGSVQQSDCDIQTKVGRVHDESPVTPFNASEGCSEGSIHWHYPTGQLSIRFPRSTLEELDKPGGRRKALKVCFNGDIGDGVDSLTQDVHTKRGKMVTHTTALESGNWTCARPSRGSDGVTVTFIGPESLEYYLKIIRYKVEMCNRSCMKAAKGMKGKGGRKGRKGQKGRKGNKGHKKRCGKKCHKRRDRLQPKRMGVENNM